MSLFYIWRDRPANWKSPSTVLTAHKSTGNRTFMCNNSNSQIPDIIALNPIFSMFSSKIRLSFRDLILKNFHLFMFKEFRRPENTDKLVSVQNVSLDPPEVTTTLMVDLS